MAEVQNEDRLIRKALESRSKNRYDQCGQAEKYSQYKELEKNQIVIGDSKKSNIFVDANKYYQKREISQDKRDSNKYLQYDHKDKQPIQSSNKPQKLITATSTKSKAPKHPKLSSHTPNTTKTNVGIVNDSFFKQEYPTSKNIGSQSCHIQSKQKNESVTVNESKQNKDKSFERSRPSSNHNSQYSQHSNIHSVSSQNNNNNRISNNQQAFQNSQRAEDQYNNNNNYSYLQDNIQNVSYPISSFQQKSQVEDSSQILLNQEIDSSQTKQRLTINGKHGQKKKSKKKSSSISGLSSFQVQEKSRYQQKDHTFIESDNSILPGFGQGDKDESSHFIIDQNRGNNSSSLLENNFQNSRQNNSDIHQILNTGNTATFDGNATFEGLGQSEEKKQMSIQKKIKQNSKSGNSKNGIKKISKNGANNNPQVKEKQISQPSCQNIQKNDNSVVNNKQSISNGNFQKKRNISGNRTSTNVSQIVIDNLKKKKIEEIIAKQQEEQEEKEKQQKRLQLQIENDQIRLMNAQRFLKQRIRESQAFPWGFDQQKIKQHMKDKQQREERSQERVMQVQIHNIKCNDVYRRQQLGLEFLNNIDPSIINQLKKSSNFMEQESVQVPTSCKAKSLYDHQGLQMFIELRKQQQEYSERLEQQQKQISKQKIEENLKQLNNKAVRSISLCRKTQPAQEQVEVKRKKRSASNDGIHQEVEIDFNALENEKDSDRKFGVLYTQFKKILSHSLQQQKQSTETNQSISLMNISRENNNVNNRYKNSNNDDFENSYSHMNQNDQPDPNNPYLSRQSPYKVPQMRSSGKTSLQSFITRTSKDFSSKKPDINQSISIEKKKQRIFEQFLLLQPKFQQLCGNLRLGSHQISHQNQNDYVDPDVPSENDLVDEKLVIEEFKSSNSSLLSESSKGQRDDSDFQIYIKEKKQNIKHSSQPQSSNEMNGKELQCSLLVNNQNDCGIHQEQLRKLSHSDHTNSNSSSSPNSFRQPKNNLMMLQQSSQSFQDVKETSRCQDEAGLLSKSDRKNIDQIVLEEDEEEIDNLREIRHIEQRANQLAAVAEGQNSNKAQSIQNKNKEVFLKSGNTIAQLTTMDPISQKSKVNQNTTNLKSVSHAREIQKKQVLFSSDEAATLIQKVWKGFLTRKILRDHLAMFENECYGEEEDDEILKQQIAQYLMESGQEWTEEEFEEYFLKFKAERSLEKKLMKIKNDEAHFISGNSYENQSNIDNNSSGRKRILHSNSSFDLHASSNRQNNHQKELQVEKNMNIQIGRRGRSYEIHSQFEEQESNKVTEDEILNTEDLLMDEQQLAKSAQRYHQMKENNPLLLEKPICIDYDNLLHSSQEKKQLTHSHSMKKLNENQVTTSPPIVDQFNHQVVEYDSEQEGKEEYLEFDENESYEDQINQDLGQQRKLLIEDENGQMIELDLAQMMGIDQPHFRGSDIGKDKIHRNTEESDINVHDREKEFNQVRIVSNKRKVMNLGIQINDDEDQSMHAPVPPNIKKREELQEQEVELILGQGESKGKEDLKTMNNHNNIQNLYSLQKPVPIPQQQNQVNELEEEPTEEQMKEYQEFMENLEVQRMANRQSSEDGSSRNRDRMSIQEQEKQREGKSIEKGGEEEGENEVEEYEIGFDYLLTKSQYEDSEGNVFIIEQGEQIYLGEEELAMIEEYAKFRDQQLQTEENKQQLQLNSISDKAKGEALQKEENQDELPQGDESIDEERSNKSFLQEEISEGTNQQSQQSQQYSNQSNNKTEIEDSQRCNNEAHVHQSSFEDIQQSQTQSQLQQSQDSHQKSVSNIDKSNSQFLSAQREDLDDQKEEEEEKEQEQEQDNSSSKVSELEKTKQEQAKQWTDIMSMLKSFDAKADPKDIFEQIIAKSQQNLQSLMQGPDDSGIDHSMSAGEGFKSDNKNGSFNKDFFSPVKKSNIESISSKKKEEINIQEGGQRIKDEYTDEESADKKVNDNLIKQNKNNIFKKKENSDSTLEKNYSNSATSLLGKRAQLVGNDSGTNIRKGLLTQNSSLQVPQILLSQTGRSHTTPNHRQSDQEGDEEWSSTGGSVFEAAPFQEFAQKKFKEFYSREQNIEQQSQCLSEEKQLQHSQQEDMDMMSESYSSLSKSNVSKSRQFSPKSYDIKIVINSSSSHSSHFNKQDQKEQSAIVPLVRTNRDILFIEKMKQQGLDHSLSHSQLLMMSLGSPHSRIVEGDAPLSSRTLDASSIVVDEKTMAKSESSREVRNNKNNENGIKIIESYEPNELRITNFKKKLPYSTNNEALVKLEEDTLQDSRNYDDGIAKSEDQFSIENSTKFDEKLRQLQLAESSFNDAEKDKQEFEEEYQNLQLTSDKKPVSDSSIKEIQSSENGKYEQISRMPPPMESPTPSLNKQAQQHQGAQEEGWDDNIDDSKGSEIKMKEEYFEQLLQQTPIENEDIEGNNTFNQSEEQINYYESESLDPKQPSPLQIFKEKIEIKIGKENQVESTQQLPNSDAQIESSKNNNNNGKISFDLASASQQDIQNLYNSYHNNYSLSETLYNCSQSEGLANLADGFIGQQIHQSNLIHAANQNLIQQFQSSAKSSAEKCSDLNSSSNSKQLEDDQYLLSQNQSNKTEEEELKELSKKQSIFDIPPLKPKINNDMKKHNNLLPSQPIESEDSPTQTMYQGNEAVIPDASDKYCSELFLEEESMVKEYDKDIHQYQNLMKQKQPCPLETADEVYSDHESESNEPISLDQGFVLPRQDVLQDELPELPPRIEEQDEMSNESDELEKKAKSDLITEDIVKLMILEFAKDIQQQKSLIQNLCFKDQLQNHQPEESNQKIQQRENNKQQQQQDDAAAQKEIDNQKLKSQIPPQRKLEGIPTNIVAVSNYLSKLSDYIKVHYEANFLERINISLGPSAVEMLKFLHFTEQSASADSQFLENSSDLSLQHQAVLTTDLYSTFEMLLLDERQKQPQLNHEMEEQWRVSLKDMTHIHNKVIFDAFNEALDNNRVYGLKGKPFPWKVDSSKICCAPIIKERIPEILVKASQRVVEWAASQCGIIFDKQGFNPVIGSEEAISTAKEKRLTAMLNQEVKEAEDKWIVYDDEHTEIQVEIAEYLFDELIAEASLEIKSLTTYSLTKLFSKV